MTNLLPISQGNILEEIIQTESFKSIAEDILSTVPLVNSLLKATNCISDLHEKIFERKIIYFLSELKEIPVQVRKNKIEEINKSDLLQNSIGTILLEQLDKIDIEYKPKVLGKLFSAYLNEKITLEDYLRLAHIIKNMFYLDLKSLKNDTKNNIYLGNSEDTLQINGLVQVDNINKIKLELNKEIHSLSDEPLLDTKSDDITLTVLGELLVKFGLY